MSIYYHFISAKFVTPQQIQANSPLLQAEVKVEQIWSDDIDVTSVSSGENVKIKVKGIDDGEVSPGFVLCSLSNPIKTGKVFDAQVSFTSSIEKTFMKFSTFFKYFLLDCDVGLEINCVCWLWLYHASAGNGRGGNFFL